MSLGGRTVRTCVYPGCTWEHVEPWPPTLQDAGNTEITIQAHLNEMHAGWTIDEVRGHVEAQRVRDVLSVGPNEMYAEQPPWCTVDDCPAAICGGPHVSHVCANGDTITWHPDHHNGCPICGASDDR